MDEIFGLWSLVLKVYTAKHSIILFNFLSLQMNCCDYQITCRMVKDEFKQLAQKKEPSILRTAATHLNSIKFSDFENEFSSRYASVCLQVLSCQPI